MRNETLPAGARVEGVLFDLLMAVMNSVQTWSEAAQDDEGGLAWRDAVTARMIASEAYVPYERLVAEAANQLGLPESASGDLILRWGSMQPWPDAASLTRLSLPYAFVTNCSSELAGVAADRSGLSPHFTLSAEEAGRFKPDARIYHQACRRLGSAIERTLFVSGSPYDAEGASLAGLPAVLVLRRADQRSLSASVSVTRSLDEVIEAINRA
ncbi:MAG: HAD-IA family hydrolase [Candidatus Limnocylindria bacterium]